MYGQQMVLSPSVVKLCQETVLCNGGPNAALLLAVTVLHFEHGPSACLGKVFTCASLVSLQLGAGGICGLI